MTDSHLDWGALEAARTGEAGAEETSHMERCPECRLRLEEVRALAIRLSGVQCTEIKVPSSIRESVRERARRSLRPGRRFRWAPLAAAAALLLAVLGLWRFSSTPPVPGDVDRSGRVDILDAYTLAVALRSGESVDPSLDLNGDGSVDDRDVDEIARLSVSLEEAQP